MPTSLEQKIHEIHEILVRQESRRKWKVFFLVCLWLCIIVFIGMIFFAPNILWDMIMPLVQVIQERLETSLTDMIHTQKEQFQEYLSGSLEKARDIIRP